MTQEGERKTDSMTSKAAGNLAHPAVQIAMAVGARLEAARCLESEGKIGVLEAAHHDALALARHLEALVFAGRLEAGLEEIKPRSLRADSIVRDLVAELQTSARARGVELGAQSCPPAVAMADQVGLRLLVLSMIDAALLGSRMGSQVSLGILGEAECVRIKVEGIPQASEGSSTELQAGPPVEVALEPESLQTFLEAVEPILVAHSGQWEVEWTPAGALSIVLSLPAVQAAQAPKDEHVLIIDDDPDGAFLLEQVLLKADYKVQIASNGLEGLALARSGGVCLILLDVMLPGMDGYEVCHRLKEDPASSKIPIVMISAKSRPEDRAMGIKVGADEYLTKPLTLNDVIQTVNAIARPIEGEIQNE